MDSKPPLEGLAFCCTGINSSLRQEIAAKITKLGGIHYSDLMSDVQYLIVGDRQTAKYRFCIKNRFDIKFIDSQLILSVYDYWLNGEDDNSNMMNIDNYLLPIFNGLNICFSRMELIDLERYINYFRRSIPSQYFQLENLTSLIEKNGGKYSESLTLANSCIITTVASGRRYKKGIEWKKPIVHPIWIFDSILRGAALDFDDYILNEDASYDYTTGCNIWQQIVDNLLRAEKKQIVASREPQDDSALEPSKKRLRTNSLIWNSIMDKPMHVQKQKMQDSWQDDEEEVDESSANYSKYKASKVLQRDKENPAKLFSGLIFLLIGFSQHQSNLLIKVIESNDGQVGDTHDETITNIIIPSKNGANSSSMLRILPADIKLGITAGSIRVGTEWWIERAIYYNKIIYDNWGLPIKGLAKLKDKKFQVCISGFTGIELLHIEKLLENLGFEYCQTLTMNRDLLIINVQLYKDKLQETNKELYEYKFPDIINCPISSTVSLVSTTNKINAAKKWQIPVVSLGYIWESLQLSEEENSLILPEIVDKSWCIFSPKESTGLMRYVQTINDKRVIQNKSPLMKLPSPRKPSHKKKYGRLQGTSLTSKLNALNNDTGEDDTSNNSSNDHEATQPSQISYEETDNLMSKLDSKSTTEGKTRAARKVGRYTR